MGERHEGSCSKKFPEEAGISRYGQPEEIAEHLVFMVSPAAKWVHRFAWTVARFKEFRAEREA
jgi:hypothetical protein